MLKSQHSRRLGTSILCPRSAWAMGLRFYPKQKHLHPRYFYECPTNKQRNKQESYLLTQRTSNGYVFALLVNSLELWKIYHTYAHIQRHKHSYFHTYEPFLEVRYSTYTRISWLNKEFFLVSYFM